MSGLSANGVRVLLEYERDRANKLPVVNVPERRAEALASGAEPFGPVLDDSDTMNHGPATRSHLPPRGLKIGPPSHGTPDASCAAPLNTRA